MARLDRWLVNKLVRVEVPHDSRRNGYFHSRILGLHKGTLYIAVPTRGKEAAWVNPNTELYIHLDPSGSAAHSAGLEPSTLQPLRVQVTGRRLKPVPLLELKVVTDLPLHRADWQRNSHILAVTSGKGGTGKTTISLNLGWALAARGVSVALVDADIGTANAAVTVGLSSPRTLLEVVQGKASILDIGLRVHGLTIYPGIVGGSETADLSPWQYGRLLGAVAELEKRFDVVILDTGAGLGLSVTNFLLIADEVVLVLNPFRTSLLDGYGAVKSMTVNFWMPPVALVMNRVADSAAAAAAAAKFAATATQYLGMNIRTLGLVREDIAVIESLQNQSPLVPTNADSHAAQDIIAAARGLLPDWEAQKHP